MTRVRHVCLALSVAALAFTARPHAAADPWLEVKSANFRVITNTNERKARNIIWQFEQVRAAIAKGWPWARVTLDRPVLVIAAKDENSMRALAPEYWERRGESKPSSVFGTGRDHHYVALRADIEVEDQGMNPYNSAFWTYTALVLEQSFDHGLPLWYSDGLASVLSNTIIRDKEIQFGKPIPWHIRELQEGPRLKLSEFLKITRDSPYLRNAINNQRFDAQAWALVQYLLFGRRDGGAGLDQVTQMLLNGVPGDAAITQVFGSLDALDDAYTRYISQGVFTFGRLQVESDTSPARMPARVLGIAEYAAARAAWHVTTGRPVEARAQIAEARKADATFVGTDDAEALLFDYEKQAAQALVAFRKAADGGSTNFWTHYRLAGLLTGPTVSPEVRVEMVTRLERAAVLNPNYPETFAFLGGVHLSNRQYDKALETIRRAVELEPGRVSHRVLAARALIGLMKTAEAQALLQDALPLAQNEQEQRSIQTLLASLSR